MGRTCFISFKAEDIVYKDLIQNHLDIDMIDKSLNEAINSEDEDFILSKIRSDYLSNSKVTIHLIGTRSAEDLGQYEQRFIKRELQASLYNGRGNTRSGILGVVLPEVHDSVFLGYSQCRGCGMRIQHVAVNNSATIREFNYNYYIPNDKCHHTQDDRYCILVSWREFCSMPEYYIENAFSKIDHPISSKIRVYPE